jgi:ATP-dependent protease ClpP protease subunit
MLGILLCSVANAAGIPFFGMSKQPQQHPDAKAIRLTARNHVLLSGPVNDKSVSAAQVELGKLAVTNLPNTTIYLVLDTPGGSVMAGNQLADFAKSLPVNVKPVCIFCASMGYHLFQSFGERLVQPSSVLMSHRVSLSGVEGQIPGELISRIKFYTDMSEEMDKAVAKRVGLTTEQYKAAIYDELWLTGTQAVNTKHADRLANFYCTNDLLEGYRTETVNTIFGPVEITMSKCPLITGIISFKFQQVLVQPRNNFEVIQSIKKTRRTFIKEWF